MNTINGRNSSSNKTKSRMDNGTSSNQSDPKKKIKSENIRVVVRCRDFRNEEKAKKLHMSNLLKIFPENGSIDLEIRKPSNHIMTDRESLTSEKKTFSFDYVFDQKSTQKEIFEKTALPIIDGIFKGYNGTIFAYGQTGSGKSYTVDGDERIWDKTTNVNLDEETISDTIGIMPRTFNTIFQRLIQETSDSQSNLVTMSYLEIYNNKIRDLLLPVSQRKPLSIYEDKGEVIVKGLTLFPVENIKQVTKLLKMGRKRRVVGETASNKHSSRSHAVVTITIEQQKTDQSLVLDTDPSLNPNQKKSTCLRSKLHIVDLAGSERMEKAKTSGLRAREGAQINLSLITLGKVISLLASISSSSSSREKPHIPYRDSELTRLLKNSIGGNAKTTMIATISPMQSNSSETLNTLRYAARAKLIKNKPKINEDPRDAMVRRLKEEIDSLTSIVTNLKSRVSGTNSDSLSIEERETAQEDLIEMQAIQVTIMKQLQAKVKAQEMVIQAAKSQIQAERHRVNQDNLRTQQQILFEREQKQQLEIRIDKLMDQLQAGSTLLQQAQVREQVMAELRQALIESVEKIHSMRNEIHQLKSEALTSNSNSNNIKTQQLSTELDQTKNRLSQISSQHSRALETIVELTKRIKFSALIMNHFIPSSDLKLIENSLVWNETTNSWHIPFGELTGNYVNQQTISSKTNSESNNNPNSIPTSNSLMNQTPSPNSTPSIPQSPDTPDSLAAIPRNLRLVHSAKYRRRSSIVSRSIVARSFSLSSPVHFPRSADLNQSRRKVSLEIAENDLNVPPVPMTTSDINNNSVEK